MADETENDSLAAAGSTRPAPLIRAPAQAAAPMAVCPARPGRPRDLEQYRTAAAAADGDPVEEIDACAVQCDMTIWFPEPAPGRWRPVKATHVAGRKTVIEFVAPAPYSSSWTVASDRPVVRRITSREVPHVVTG